MQSKIDALVSYFSTDGTLADALAFAQMVAAEAWGEISKLYKVIEGLV